MYERLLAGLALKIWHLNPELMTMYWFRSARSFILSMAQVLAIMPSRHHQNIERRHETVGHKIQPTLILSSRPKTTTWTLWSHVISPKGVRPSPDPFLAVPSPPLRQLSLGDTKWWVSLIYRCVNWSSRVDSYACKFSIITNAPHLFSCVFNSSRRLPWKRNTGRKTG